MSSTFKVSIGAVTIGGGLPVVIQSMTDTQTSDISSTVDQILSLYNEGSEVVRLTVDDYQAAEAIPVIKSNLMDKGCHVPLVGDFHYNGHDLLTSSPGCAMSLDKYRINPGNVGFGKKKDEQFAEIINVAINYNKPIRIGVNWGSLDKNLLKTIIDSNSTKKNPMSYKEIIYDTVIESALSSAKYAEKIGLPRNKIIISCKVSNVQDLIIIYQRLSKLCNYPLHLGLTESGMGLRSIVSSSIGLGILLNQGIGDTIRVSLTPNIGENRSNEVKVCKHILQSLNIRIFSPSISSCPGCGRASGKNFLKMTDFINKKVSLKISQWKKMYHGVENMKIAVMGCVVNGPGESKYADVGISLPGKRESLVAPVFIKGKLCHTLRGNNISEDFLNIICKYVKENYEKKM